MQRIDDFSRAVLNQHIRQPGADSQVALGFGQRRERQIEAQARELGLIQRDGGLSRQSLGGRKPAIRAFRIAEWRGRIGPLPFRLGGFDETLDSSHLALRRKHDARRSTRGGN